MAQSISLKLLAASAVAVATVIVIARETPKQYAPGANDRNAADEKGRTAETPEAIPARGLREVFWRVVREVSEDRVMLIAAGVTFYLLLAIFPGLTALVSLYGLVADPITISDHLRKLAGLLPPGAFDLLADQITAVAERRDSTLGFTFFIGLGAALWSTRAGVLAIFDAMNIAYEEEEKRGFIKLNLLGIAFTLCALASAILLVGLVAVLPAVLSFVWLEQSQEQLALLLRWPVLVIVVVCAIVAVYRFGPSRAPARIRWMTWGAALTCVAWIGMSVGFSHYLTKFADYNATYGTLGALIGLLVWTWLSVAILIIGAELNAELEHQTAMDSTTGPPLPIGFRGAVVADTVA